MFREMVGRRYDLRRREIIILQPREYEMAADLSLRELATRNRYRLMREIGRHFIKYRQSRRSGAVSYCRRKALRDNLLVVPPHSPISMTATSSGRRMPPKPWAWRSAKSY